MGYESKYKPINIQRTVSHLFTNREALVQQNSEFFPEPSAHKSWIQDRVPRGTHYDPADDGPETDPDYMAWVAHVVLGVTKATTLQALSDVWLDSYSVDFGDKEFDFLVHGRE